MSRKKLPVFSLGRVASTLTEAIMKKDRADPEVVCPIGDYAVESIPARSKSQKFDESPGGERDQINEIGSRFGCHTCGIIFSFGSKKGYVPDHQPISSWVPDGFPQRLYPQCLKCSREQAGWARQLAPIMWPIYERIAKELGY
ncbi:hypothetical protein [Streptomyces sp. NK15101]|uniref:hypothetical protein n=1 Tax=Streptomyces sp. NK15101 TaxID=2873261 RepID=UPI001CEDB083|nr:hypothetical protein [Streptomyces sp. NK15101]